MQIVFFSLSKQVLELPAWIINANTLVNFFVKTNPQGKATSPTVERWTWVRGGEIEKSIMMKNCDGDETLVSSLMMKNVI